MAIVRTCDLCEAAGAERYSLNASGSRGRGEKNSAVGMGGLDICPTCWHEYAEPRMRHGTKAISDLGNQRVDLPCTRCAVEPSEEPTYHFALRLWKRKGDGRYTSVGRGAITLCKPCWSATAAPNIRPGFENKSFDVFARLMKGER